jgi:putative phosphoesterase
MLIGVISDTHVPTAAPAVPVQAKRALAGVDLILHAGDLVDLGVLAELRAIAPVKAVHGNMDPVEVARALPEKLIVEAGSVRIGLMHGKGAPSEAMEFVRNEFASDDVKVVVFGHSHQALEKTVGGVLYFNPGSPTSRGFAPFCSVGLLTIGDTITSRIVRL